MTTDSTLLRRGTAAFFAASMVFGFAACGDDDDGVDSEEIRDDVNDGVDDVEEKLDDAGDEIQQQIDEGTEEDNESD